MSVRTGTFLFLLAALLFLPRAHGNESPGKEESKPSSHPRIQVPKQSAPPESLLVSKAVAQVSQSVITSREVIISHVLDLALAQKKAAPLDRSKWLIRVGSDDFDKELAQIILESVVQLEADNFSIAQVSTEEVQNLTKHADEILKDWSVWTELEVGTVEVEKIIGRKMRAKSFLKFKMETSGVQISDDEAKTFYEKNRVKFGNMPFSQFKDSIKEVLAQEQMQEKLKDWFEILKRKYRVKLLGNAS